MPDPLRDRSRFVTDPLTAKSYPARAPHNAIMLFYLALRPWPWSGPGPHRRAEDAGAIGRGRGENLWSWPRYRSRGRRTGSKRAHRAPVPDITKTGSGIHRHETPDTC